MKNGDQRRESEHIRDNKKRIQSNRPDSKEEF